MSYSLHTGDCLDVLRTMPDNSIDSIVTDPPYGLRFMGRKWDYDVPSVDVWTECRRVLKPGGHLLSFGGSRTYHRMVCAVEDAGFEIRDQIMWIYGSGFPKSLDVGKALDKAAGHTRARIPHSRSGGFGDGISVAYAHDKWTTANAGTRSDPSPITKKGEAWQGWGTALKPAHEPIVVARKPLIGTVAANVLEHGTGALNIDGCRIGTTGARNNGRAAGTNGIYGEIGATTPVDYGKGRWPANIIHDGSDEVLAEFPRTASGRKSGGQYEREEGMYSGGHRMDGAACYADSGSAARFFYCAKASGADRNDGCDALESKLFGMSSAAAAAAARGEQYENGDGGVNRVTARKNNHPTVKPTDLMRYLCRLITPPGGVVLDPFMGSGSTGRAALLDGFSFIGIERDADYTAIAAARVQAVLLRMTA